MSALDPASIEHRLTVPGEQAEGQESRRCGVGEPRARLRQGRRAARGGANAHTTVTEGAGADAAETEEGDVVLAPPVERSVEARDPRTMLPQPELEPENAMYDGRYDDGVIGDLVDPRAPDAWKKAAAIWHRRVCVLSEHAVAAARICRRHCSAGEPGTVPHRRNDGHELAGPLLSPGIAFCSCRSGALVSAALYAVIEDTGNGQREVNDWPDWDIRPGWGRRAICRWRRF